MKKREVKKLISAMISMMIGAAIGFAIVSGMFQIDMSSEYTSLPFYVNVLIVLFTYFMAVGLHELGHAVSFVKNGFRMRAVVVMILLFIKEDGRWKMKVRPNAVTAIGGIAVPDLDAVKDEADFKQKQRGYAKAVIAGPVASVIVWLGLSTIALLVMFSVTNAYVKSGMFTFTIALTLITLFLLATSLIKSEIAIGDFPAYSLAKNDRFFMAMQFYQYAFFSSDKESARSKNNYVKGVIFEELQKKLEKQDTDLFTMHMMDTFITEYLIGRLTELPPVVKDYVDFLQENPVAFSKLKESELTLIVYLHILRLWYLQPETKEQALGLYEELKSELKPNTAMRSYLLKQADHVFGLADNEEFLRNKNNICISPAHGIWKNFDGYYADEIKLNERIFENEAVS
ncbi:hypothetical protein SAMN05421736_11394 [Evansella caseinilytica]|uniref:Peptidase M50 domain-containing protein n=1 Tax=Evansella caseinilytica TaxID=1503961 RepID=A0A1H3T808_9BACI|nr:site-2 protease family protein [Evansella caseinilytica]SDZ46190.1 hypothetical protein SAMN05421736_11394 [Evansella caseinilytica]